MAIPHPHPCWDRDHRLRRLQGRADQGRRRTRGDHHPGAVGEVHHDGAAAPTRRLRPAWRLDDHGGQEGRLALGQLLATPLVDQAGGHIELARDVRHDRTRREHRLQDLQPLRIAPPTPPLRPRHHRHLGHAVQLRALLRTTYERSIRPQHPPSKAALTAGLRRACTGFRSSAAEPVQCARVERSSTTPRRA